MCYFYQISVGPLRTKEQVANLYSFSPAKAIQRIHEKDVIDDYRGGRRDGRKYTLYRLYCYISFCAAKS